MAAKRLVVVGGDAAGMSGASQARRMLSPDDLEIVAFERSPHTSYSACGLPYLAGGVVTSSDRLIVRTPEVFRSESTIDAKVRHEVTGIDLGARRVSGTDLASGRPFDEAFDLLLIATGTEPVRPAIEGIDAEGIFGLSTLESGIAMTKALDDRRPARAVVVGGGYIGLETAEALVGRGIRTTLVEAEAQLMGTLDADMAEPIAKRLSESGVELHLDEKVEAFETRGGKVSAVVTSARTIPAELVVLGLGTRPQVEPARSAGVEVGESGALRVDDHMRTSHVDVYAAGDCAEQFHRVSEMPVNFHLGTIANKMGKIAGVNIGGGDARFPGVLGTAITRVFELEVARTGLSSREAQAAGLDYVAAASRSRNKPSYLPGSERMTLKVIAEKPSGRLLGAQIVGGTGSGKRIDVFAVALWNEMTVADIVNLDLAYVPPLSTVWDPVLIAARRAVEALG